MIAAWRRVAVLAGALTSAHLMGLLLWVVVLLTRGPQLFGAFGREAQGQFLWILIGRAVLTAAVQFLPLALLLGLLMAWIERRVTSPSRRLWGILFGFGTYLSLAALILLQAPGAFAAYPGLNRLPFAAVYLLLVAAALGGATLPFLMRRAVKLGAVWLVVLTGITLIPHDSWRALTHLAARKLPPETPRVLLFTVDAARLDEWLRTVPPDVARATWRGISHFSATRKQWRLFLTGDRPGVERSYLIPTTAELQPDSTPQLPDIARAAGASTILLINDPTTANPQTLASSLDAFWSPPGGIQTLLLADNAALPVTGWLWNILGRTESANRWGREDVFRRDVARALKRYSVVLAHDVTLQRGLRSIADYQRFAPGSWMWRRPIDFTVPAGVSDGQGYRQLDALDVYRSRLRSLAEGLIPWTTELAEEYPLAGVLTSDHGQEFRTLAGSGIHLAGVHGWDISPETVWVPVVPFGRASIAPGAGSANVSWLGIRRGILDWLARSDSLWIEPDTGVIRLRFRYTEATHLSGLSESQLSPGIATMTRLSRAVNLDWSHGWSLDERRLGDFLYAEGEVRGELLLARNPAPDGTITTRVWRLYSPRSDH